MHSREKQYVCKSTLVIIVLFKIAAILRDIYWAVQLIILLRFMLNWLSNTFSSCDSQPHYVIHTIKKIILNCKWQTFPTTGSHFPSFKVYVKNITYKLVVVKELTHLTKNSSNSWQTITPELVYCIYASTSILAWCACTLIYVCRITTVHNYLSH